MAKAPVIMSVETLAQLTKAHSDEAERRAQSSNSSPFSDDELLLDDDDSYNCDYPALPASTVDDGVDDVDELKARLRAARYELAQVNRQYAAVTELAQGEMSCAAPPGPRKVVVVGNVVNSAKQAPAARKGVTIARMCEEQRQQARNMYRTGIHPMKERLRAVAQQVDASGRSVRRVMRLGDRRRVELFLESCLTSGLLRQFAGVMSAVRVDLGNHVLQQQMVASALLRLDGNRWTDMPLTTLAEVTACDLSSWGVSTTAAQQVQRFGETATHVATELRMSAVERPYDVARLAVMEPTQGFVPIDTARGVFQVSEAHEEIMRRLNWLDVKAIPVDAWYSNLNMDTELTASTSGLPADVEEVEEEAEEEGTSGIPAYGCPPNPTPSPPSSHPHV